MRVSNSSGPRRPAAAWAVRASTVFSRSTVPTRMGPVVPGQVVPGVTACGLFPYSMVRPSLAVLR
jgi:hypothetical protein